MKRHLMHVMTSVVTLLFVVVLALPAHAQDDAPSITANEQYVLSGAVEISSVYYTGPGFVVIHADNGEGAPGAVIGYAPVDEGRTDDLKVSIDTASATPTLYAMLHTDDNTLGDYEFGQVEGADAPVKVDDAVVVTPFDVQLLSANDQLVTDGTVTVNAIVQPEAGWAVVHANTEEDNPGDVLGYAQYGAGTTTGLTIDLGDSTPTDVLWVMLHQDTGEAGTYEFGQVEGADAPVMTGGELPMMVRIWTVPQVHAADQSLHGNNTLVFAQVLIDQPGWLVIHADDNGNPGPVLGYAALNSGTNMGVTVEVEPVGAGSNVWAMLHYDTGEAGSYEFGTVEGADGPVTRDGTPVMSPLTVLESGEMMGAADDDVMGESEEMMEAVSVDVSLSEWAIEMPSSISAGTVTFNVTNNGTAPHNFEIEGNGVEMAFDQDLQPGESNSIMLELEPGTYQVYCPIEGHADQGMQLELTVE